MRCYSAILILFVSFTCVFTGKIKKKSIESTTQQPAIIAIEIVDPNENSTSSKNSKRTIESALGYGYNSYDTSKPRYEIYKYSQHDIPPYKGTPTIQKSIQYSLPTITEHVPSSLKPGTTLYSSVSSKGQVGGLRSSLEDVSNDRSPAPVPVIVLRIYPDQLKDSSIQANLPDYHPFAKTINSINIQSLLEHYIKALKPAQEEQEVDYGSRQQYHQQQYYQRQSEYQQPQYHQQQQQQLPLEYEEPQYQQPQKLEYHQQHQQQIQYEQPQYQQQQQPEYIHQQQQYGDYNAVEVQKAPAKYELSYQSSPAPPQSVSQPQQQFYYVTPNDQYYQSQQYNQDDQQQQYHEEPKLLTHENYPSDKHTRVIFRNNAKLDEPTEPVKEVKTIHINVPDNVADVKVEETEDYGYQHNEDRGGQYSAEQQYYAQPEPFNYQNVDYGRMAKYLAARSAMPSYFYQSEAEDKGQEEEVTPATVMKKKMKGKKRTI